MSNQIQTIIFDFGNVIARFDVQVFLTSLSHFTHLTLEELKLALRGSSDVIASYETGMISSEEFFSRISRNCALTITREQFIDAYINIFTPVRTTIDLIPKLKSTYKLGLLSNTSEWHFQHNIQPTPVFHLFDAVTLSFRVKARKPSEAIYRDMLSQLHTDPQHCVYIDDIAEFTDAAERLGMIGIHYTSHEQLLESLKDIGVRVPEE